MGCESRPVWYGCYLQHAVQYRSVYLAPELCESLPQLAGCMRMGPIVKAILLDFGPRGADANHRSRSQAGGWRA